MEIKGNDGYLSDVEQEVTGLPSPIDVNEIDTLDLLSRIDERRQGLEAMQATDGDELTHAERASIVPGYEKLNHDRQIIESMAAQITAHQAGVFLQEN